MKKHEYGKDREYFVTLSINNPIVKMAYSQDQIEVVFLEICEKLVKGIALRTILKADNMPSPTTFFKWIKEDNSKMEQYARAKEMYADKVFDDIVLIADGTGDDVLVDEDGVEQINHNIIQRDRLRIDARKWHLSKLFPKKYGEKLETENTHSGEIRIIRQIKE